MGLTVAVLVAVSAPCLWLARWLLSAPATLHEERLLATAETERAALGGSGMWDDESAGWG